MLPQTFGPVAAPGQAGPQNTTAISVLAASQRSILPAKTGSNGTQVRIVNSGPDTIYWAWGYDNTVVAAIPSAGVPANGIAMLQNTVETFTLPPQVQWIAVIGATGGTNTLYITIGEGV